ncbi:MAG: DinB family protein [bacterium]
MAKPRSKPRVAKEDEILAWIIRRCDETYRRGNWSGPGVGKALKGVTPEEAHWRPQQDQHHIAELVLHMAYWKDAATAILAGQPWKYDDAQNWRTAPDTAEGWVQARAELDRAHGRLMRTLRGLPRARLMKTIHRSVRGIDFAVDIATHDTYHSAQIFVLRRLYSGRAPRTHGA